MPEPFPAATRSASSPALRVATLPAVREFLLAAGVLLGLVSCQGLVLLHVFGLGHESLKLHDYRMYHQAAVNLLDHGTFSMEEREPFLPTMFRPPGYPIYIAAVYRLLGRSVLAVRWTQFLLHAATCWLLYAGLRRWRPHGAALLAAVLAACYSPLVFMAGLYVGHTLSAFLCALVLCGLIWMGARRGPSIVLAFVLGCALGFLTLVRPSFQGLALPIILALLWLEKARPFRTRLGQAMVFSLGVLITIAPWLLRNNILTDGQSGTRVMVGGWALWTSSLQYSGKVSYKLLKPEWDILIREFNARNLMAERLLSASKPNDTTVLLRQELWVERSFNQSALDEIRAAPPVKLLESLIHRPFWLWSTSDVSPWQTGLFHRAVQVVHVLMAVVVVLGLARARADLRALWPLWVLAAYQTALHFIYHVEPRFTLEGRLFMIGFTSYLFSASSGPSARTPADLASAGRDGTPGSGRATTDAVA